MKVRSLAGKPPELGMLVNVPKLITAYYASVPDPAVPAQRVAFGTSGHRGSSFQKAFNEWLNLTVVNDAVDPIFRFMAVDWDGQIRGDPSSPYGIQPLVDIRIASRSIGPATPLVAGTGLSRGVRVCCHPTITFPWPSSTSSNTDRSGAR